MSGGNRNRRQGLTLIELILAIALLAIVATVAYFSFEAGVKAWRVGTELSDDLQHADYVIEQIAMGLRSAYYPDAERPVGTYGFVLTDNGEGASAHDTISWVKLGTALIGADAEISDTPHRIEVSSVASDQSKDGESGLTVRAWRTVALPEDFDPDEDVATLYLTPDVVAFNCRVLDPANNLAEGRAPAADDELEWLDTWDDDLTNRLPYAVEISLSLKPIGNRDEAVEVKRIIELPLAPLAWRDKGAAGGSTPSDNRPQPSRDQRGRTQSGGVGDRIRRDTPPRAGSDMPDAFPRGNPSPRRNP